MLGLTAEGDWLTDSVCRGLLWGVGTVVALIGVAFIGIGPPAIIHRQDAKERKIMNRKEREGRKEFFNSLSERNQTSALL
jgi:hypothetical protein